MREERAWAGLGIKFIARHNTKAVQVTVYSMWGIALLTGTPSSSNVLLVNMDLQLSRSMWLAGAGS